MAEYAPIFTKPYENGWVNAPPKKTPVTAEIMNNYDGAIENIESYLANNPISNGGGSGADLNNFVVGNSIFLGRKADTAIGEGSVATGGDVIASGKKAHAQGFGSVASGENSHAEGAGVTASGYNSHAEGAMTVARGEESHAEGLYTVAARGYQHVQGKFNVEDTQGKYAHIVGGGVSPDNRKNIHALDWEGNAEFTGTVKSAGLRLTDTVTNQEYTLTITNGNMEITEV